MTKARPMTLQDYMELPWKPQFARETDGSYRVTIAQLHDFELFGPLEEVQSEWRDALRGLLRAYIKTQKTIPLPPMEMSAEPEGEGAFALSWKSSLTAA